MKKVWYVENLWEISKDLPIVEFPIEKINGPDEVTWFSENNKPTCRAIADHCKRINNADINYPILLTEDKKVFDGMHRIARCIMEGKKVIKAKVFKQNPKPDEIYEK